MDRSHGHTSDLTRRAALASLAAAGITLVAGCGGGGAGSVSDRAVEEANAALSSLGEPALQAVAAIIGSGKVTETAPAFLPDSGLIVTKTGPTSYRVYSQICTHQGAKITGNDGRGRLVCPLHSSIFNPVTGEPEVGPAGKPLVGKNVTLTNGKATLA